MKKIRIIIVILVLLTVFTGCGKKVEEKENTQLPNPIIEYNAIEELNEAVGYQVPRLDKKVDQYISINKEQARVIYEDGSVFDMRKTKEEDISGYYGFEELETNNIRSIKVTVYESPENQSRYGIWNEGEYAYSYYVLAERVDSLLPEIKDIMNLKDYKRN